MSVEAHTRTKMLSIVGPIRYEASKGRRADKGGRYYPKILLDECGETLFGKLNLQAKTPNRDLTYLLTPWCRVLLEKLTRL